MSTRTLPPHLPKYAAVMDGKKKRPLKLSVGMDGSFFYGDPEVGLAFDETTHGEVIFRTTEKKFLHLNGAKLVDGTKEEYRAVCLKAFGTWDKDL